jgi:hypothetical protein
MGVPPVVKVVHADLYAYAAKLAYLAPRTTMFARTTMAKVVSQAVEKKYATSDYEAYRLASPIVTAAMAITPAEAEYNKFVGSPVTQAYQDLANNTAKGDIELQLTPYEKWCRRIFIGGNGALIVIFATIMVMLAWQAPWGAASIAGCIGAIGFAIYAFIDLYYRYKQRSKRIIPSK